MTGLHYGWVHAKLQTNAAAGTTGPIILDWAYETRPYTAIVAGATTQTATAEWHSLESLGLPSMELLIPTSLALSPATPTITNRISFVSPANGLTYLNSIAAEAEFGAPLISVDSTNRTITVTFTPPLDEAIPQIVFPAGGVDGEFGPLAAGTWTFQVLTNSYTFTVAGGSPLAIAPVGKQIVVSWPTAATNYFYKPQPIRFLETGAISRPGLPPTPAASSSQI